MGKDINFNWFCGICKKQVIVENGIPKHLYLIEGGYNHEPTGLYSKRVV